MNNNARQEAKPQTGYEIQNPIPAVATIIAFTLANNEPTVNTIVAEYPLTNTVKLSIERPFNQDNIDSTYLVAVRSLDSDGNVSRYILQRPADLSWEILYPDYSGQTLEAGAIIEIWADKDSTLITATADIVFRLNTLAMYDLNYSQCYCGNLVGDSLTLDQTVMSPQTTGACNPFCDCAILAN